jgi:hypothetical protein
MSSSTRRASSPLAVRSRTIRNRSPSRRSPSKIEYTGKISIRKRGEYGLSEDDIRFLNRLIKPYDFSIIFPEVSSFNTESEEYDYLHNLSFNEVRDKLRNLSPKIIKSIYDRNNFLLEMDQADLDEDPIDEALRDAVDRRVRLRDFLQKNFLD